MSLFGKIRQALSHTGSGSQLQYQAGRLEDEDWRIRVEAIQSLAEGCADDSVVEAIATRLSDPYPYVRMQALSALSGFPIELTRRHLAQALDDGNPEVRRAAIDLLTSCSDPACTAALSRILLQGNHSESRIHAGRMLGQIPEREAMEALIQGLCDPSAKIRRTCADSLCRLSGNPSDLYGENQEAWRAWLEKETGPPGPSA